MIYFTSDLHFGHGKKFLYGPRGFNSIEEHDKEVINRWNSVVNPNDTVYVLGDLILGNNDEGFKKLDRLNGIICVIGGNHDTDRRITIYKDSGTVDFKGFAERLKYHKWSFFLSHYPTIVANFEEEKKVWNLHGHTHSKDKFSDKPHCYNVALDAHDCYPVSIEEIIKDIKEREYNEIN